MLFNSFEFFIFYSLLFPLYWLVHKNVRARNLLLLIGSYVFYASWDWRFLSLIIISTLVDFHCGQQIQLSNDDKQRRRYLAVSVLVNLGILGVFKYFGFFVSSFIDLMNLMGLQANYFSLNIILPVGISFYTFQTLSYTIDIYRRRMDSTSSLLNFSTFVAFFPQLVAGPIERACALLPQLEGATKFDFVRFREGCFLILWGLVKKVLIADRLAVYVDAVFADPSAFTGAQSLIAVLFFSVQIYCDFSGYSDIARGLGKTMGIELMVNFNTPYFASSIKEFWQRWHISLSSWFRDYVYIPLGGSRVGKVISKRNLVITFLVSGLWHGAAYTFAVWGLLHAVGNILDPNSYFRGDRSKAHARWQIYIGFLWTYLFVNLAWVFFRASSLPDAMFILGSITGFVFEGMLGASIISPDSLIVAMNNTEFGLSIYFIGLLFITDYFLKDRGMENLSTTLSLPWRWLYSWFLLINFLMLAPSDTGAFIYFQF